MDEHAKAKLNLSPRSEQELHDAYDRFLTKWEHKARRVLHGQRVARSRR